SRRRAYIERHIIRHPLIEKNKSLQEEIFSKHAHSWLYHSPAEMLLTIKSKQKDSKLHPVSELVDRIRRSKGDGTQD
ncbi:MAG: hypothetical protein OXT03_05600, partial [Alphaproteobacteria bacterium]|nr:hypothetical protein [Alphaproteobacteria bacterium]